jgi:hypothetical protein
MAEKEALRQAAAVQKLADAAAAALAKQQLEETLKAEKVQRKTAKQQQLQQQQQEVRTMVSDHAVSSLPAEASQLACWRATCRQRLPETAVGTCYAVWNDIKAGH